MKTKLHMARREDLARLVPMVAAFHAESGIVQDDETRHDAILPLVEGSPHGVIYIIGPRNAPVGYVAISFGWSIEMGGVDGYVDEFWIRPAVRDKGMGGEALSALVRALKDAGVRALHLEAARGSKVERLYGRLGFTSRENYFLMTADLTRP